MLLGKIPEGSLRENNQSTICLVPLRDLYCSQSFVLSELLFAHPYFKLDIKQDPMFKPLLIKQETKFCTFQLFNYPIGCSPNGRSRNWKALLMATFTKCVFLNSHTNSVFLSSLKWPAPVTNTFFASRGCPLTRASTVCLQHF